MSCCGCSVIVTGGGSANPPPPPDPAVDPDPCNTLTLGPDGLLVPGTDVIGVVGDLQPAITTERSVDIDVVETPGCPNLYIVGARLTPVSGLINTERINANLLATPGVEVPIPESDIVLPEDGKYFIDTDVRYLLSTETGGSGYIVGHLIDVASGAPLVSFTQIASINSLGQEHQGGTTHIGTEYVVAGAPRTVRLVLILVITGGTIEAAEAGGTDSNGATRMRWLKVAD